MDIVEVFAQSSAFVLMLFQDIKFSMHHKHQDIIHDFLIKPLK